jgi:hypothetical protein
MFQLGVAACQEKKKKKTVFELGGWVVKLFTAKVSNCIIVHLRLIMFVNEIK